MKGQRSRGKTSVVRIQACRRGTQFLKLRLEGCTYEQIAARMGVSIPRSYQVVANELKRLNEKRTEAAEAGARMELLRLDDIFKSVWQKARNGDITAQTACLKLMERRAKLLGLDASDKNGPQAAATLTLQINEVVVNRETLA